MACLSLGLEVALQFQCALAITAAGRPTTGDSSASAEGASYSLDNTKSSNEVLLDDDDGKSRKQVILHSSHFDDNGNAVKRWERN